MAKVLIMINESEENVRISRMKVKQLKKALKKIQEVISFVQADESTADLMQYFMDMDKGTENLDEELKDKAFMENILGALKVLFNKIPDEITELIAIISGIDEEVIDEQEYDVLFDIVEAIISENDVKAMIDRAKSTFFTARSKWGTLKALKPVQA